jgi:hypothetical protein
MMRPYVWRRIAKLRPVPHLRSLNTVQRYHTGQEASQVQYPSAAGQPSFVDQSFASTSASTLPSSSRFPLYRPEPPSSPSQSQNGDEEHQFGHTVTADNIPSDRNIQKSAKTTLSSRIDEEIPEFTEEDLRDFYRAVVQSGVEHEAAPQKVIESPKTKRLEAPERAKVLGNLIQRLSGLVASSSTSAVSTALEGRNMAHTILRSVTAALPQMDQTPGVVGPGNIPLGVMSRKEWEALFDEMVCPTAGRREQWPV